MIYILWNIILILAIAVIAGAVWIINTDTKYADKFTELVTEKHVPQGSVSNAKLGVNFLVVGVLFSLANPFVGAISMLVYVAGTIYVNELVKDIICKSK